jgi:hypothetical protein
VGRKSLAEVESSWPDTFLDIKQASGGREKVLVYRESVVMFQR